MEAMAAVLRSVVLVGVMVMVVMVGSSQAYDFNVGGRDGWVQHPTESYTQWAERNRFQVNDRLVFKYRPGDDSVLVVNKEDFDACDTSRPIQRFDNGNTVIQFDRSGPFFFISGAPGRCQTGEKLVLVVMSSRRRAPPPPSPPTAAPSPPTSPSVAPSPATNQPSAPPTKPGELTPAPEPSEPSGSPSSSVASFRAVALALALGAGALLLW